jgi:hypothetical protein
VLESLFYITERLMGNKSLFANGNHRKIEAEPDDCGRYDVPTPEIKSESSAPERQRCASERTRNKKSEKRKRRDELREEYDHTKLTGVARGKYAARYKAGTNLVLLCRM